MGGMLPFVRQQAFKLGVSSPGAKLRTQLSGTDTNYPVYLDASLVTPAANPVVADSSGRFPALWLGPVTYRMTLVDANNATVWGPEDGITANIVSGADVSFIQSGTGAITRTAQAKMRERVSVLDFTGADPTGATDSTTAFNSALVEAAAQNASGPNDLINARTARVWIPRGRYRVDGQITYPSRSIVLEGETPEGSSIYLAAPDATISSAFPQSVLRNVEIFGGETNGSPVANIGVTFTAEENTLDGVTIYNFADAALVMTDATISRLFNTRLLVAPTLLRITNTAALSLIGCNFFQLASAATTAAIDIGPSAGSVADIAMIGGWAEGFTRFLRVANASGDVNLAQFGSIFTRYSSTRANARMLEVISSDVNNLCRANTVQFVGGSWNLTNTNYPIVVTLTGNMDGNSTVSVKLDNVNFPIPPSTAIVSSDVASTRLIVNDVTGVAATDYLGGSGSVTGANSGGLFGYATDTGALGNMVVEDQIYEQGRALAIGEWVGFAYSAGNFSGNGAMTWTVEDADEVVTYSRVGGQLTISVSIFNSSVGGTPDTDLRILIPASLTAPITMRGPVAAIDNGTPVQANWTVSGSGSTLILIRKLDGTAWSASTNATNVDLNATFAVTG